MRDIWKVVIRIRESCKLILYGFLNDIKYIILSFKYNGHFFVMHSPTGIITFSLLLDNHTSKIYGCVYTYILVNWSSVVCPSTAIKITQYFLISTCTVLLFWSLLVNYFLPLHSSAFNRRICQYTIYPHMRFYVKLAIKLGTDFESCINDNNITKVRTACIWSKFPMK